jgi:hypothetical protein
MDYNKKFKFFFLIFIFSLLIFLNISYNKSKIKYRIIKYNNDQIFIDRNYLNTKNSIFLKDKLLLQTSRHNNKKILLFSNAPIIVYRATCPLNDNKIYNTHWSLLKKAVNIEGVSCTHSKIYFKKFRRPIVFLNAGGPIASDPIFVKYTKEKQILKILNKHK